ncbi:MAG: hypothetical protein M3Y82_14640, partial [Verrucomicrobiota bacterium]|nr:hypothetical protein [Verrucomicrobiota bacterium]
MTAPLILLLKTNRLQMWRRLKSVRGESRLLSSLILFFVVGYLALAFGMFRLGLKFLSTFPGLGTLLTERLLFLLFAFLFVLLLLSNLVISYTNFFRNRETSFLWSLPISAQTIFRWKFLESLLLASWAFLFLIAPLLAAFGLTRQAPWHFYLVTIGSMALFIVLPGVAGAWLAVNLGRFLDRKVFQIIAVFSVLLLITAAFFWLKPEALTDDMVETRVLALLDRLLMKTRFAEFRSLPSYWLSSSVLQWSEGDLRGAGFFILELFSNALFFGFLIFSFMGHSFYESFSRVQSRGSVFGQWEWFRQQRDRKNIFNYSLGAAEKIAALFRGLGGDVRALIVKDARMFWRDTTQWGQSLV